MKCPVCNINLAMTERQGVEIDYCPECRGIWLDRGELDKIIEKSESYSTTDSSCEPELNRERVSKEDKYYSDNGHGFHKKKKRESWLGELLDFGD